MRRYFLVLGVLSACGGRVQVDVSNAPSAGGGSAAGSAGTGGSGASAGSAGTGGSEASAGSGGAVACPLGGAGAAAVLALDGQACNPQIASTCIGGCGLECTCQSANVGWRWQCQMHSCPAMPVDCPTDPTQIDSIAGRPCANVGASCRAGCFGYLCGETGEGVPPTWLQTACRL